MKKAIAAVMLAALCSCTEEYVEQEATVGSIIGIVADKTTGEPVPTVRLALTPGGISTVTGSDGSFSFKNLEKGNYTVTYSKEGYRDGSDNIMVNNGQNADANLLIERIPAVITADRESLDFGANPGVTALSFNIVNDGYKTLSWGTAWDKNCKWIKEVTSSNPGKLDYGKTATILVSIDRNELKYGANEAYIIIWSDNGSSQIKITATGTGTSTSVNTLEVTGLDIVGRSVIFNGEITHKGEPAFSEKGFCLNTTGNPTLNDVRIPVSGNSEGMFSYKCTDIENRKTYYLRAYAIQHETAVYGTTMTFDTELTTASVTTSAATEITTSSATLHADITCAGYPEYTEAGFCYSTKSTPTVYDCKLTASASGTGNYTAQITGLSYNSTYYFRAYLIQNGSIVYGNTNTFTTSFVQASVSTGNAKDITENSSNVYFNVIQRGDPIAVQAGICYALHSDPTVHDMKESYSNLPFSGPLYVRLGSLSPSTCYYYRAYIIQDGKIYYGSLCNFTTAAPSHLPIVQTLDASDVHIDAIGGTAISWSVTLNGNIIDVGNPRYTDKGFIYSYNGDPTDDGTAISVKGGTTGKFSADFSDTIRGQRVYVRAYAQNKAGYAFGELSTIKLQ